MTIGDNAVGKRMVPRSLGASFGVFDVLPGNIRLVLWGTAARWDPIGLTQDFFSFMDINPGIPLKVADRWLIARIREIDENYVKTDIPNDWIEESPHVAAGATILRYNEVDLHYRGRPPRRPGPAAYSVADVHRTIRRKR